MTDRRIAVVGMAFRFPGAADEGTFWRNIRDGVCSVRRFTDDELAAAGVPPEEYQDPDFIGASGLIPGITDFDAGFFGMSGNVARATDPQQRLFLETGFHALEDAGYAAVPDGVRVGVFAGVGYHLYGHRTYLISNLIPAGWSDWVAGSLVTNGNYPDFIATRTSFELGLTGPSLGVQSACSTALTCVHLASQALLAGDADLAVAGAAAIHVPQVLGYRHVKGSILSRTGVCRAFDAEADGTVGGNGVAAVVLKRLDRALADGDTVHAVLLGSGMSNDGDSKAGYSAPSAEGQRRAVRRAFDAAGVGADTIGYLESHGTGTYKGDPIEFDGLTSAFREDTDRVGFCALGSAKPNLGHLDACAGMASLVKTILVLKNQTIPPMANFKTPNPLLPLADSPFRIPAEARPWTAGDGPRRAGINSLGVGGTNVHLIVEEAPRRARPDASGPALALLPVPLSGKSGAALAELRHRYVSYLRSGPDLDPGDLVLSAAAGRRHFTHRAVALGRDLAELAANLDGTRLLQGVAPAENAGIAFVFSGQGTGYTGMARPLHDLFPIVRDTIEDCDRHYTALTGESLLPALLGSGAAAPAADEVWPTGLAQPALFAFQTAQSRLWGSLGIRPRIVSGHSIGEYAALHVAGALTLADGMRLTVARGRLMREATAEAAMVAVFADRARIDALLSAIPALDLAAVNGETHHVIAGEADGIRSLIEVLDAQDVQHVPLPVDRAFHSRLLDPMLDDWRALAAEVAVSGIDIPFVDGPDGLVREPGWRPDADYLVRQTRQTVRFDRVLAELSGAVVGAVVEIGPGSTLTGLARRALPEATALPSQRRGREAETFVETVGRLYCAGADIDWAALAAGRGGGRVPLPRYPYQRRTYWTGPVPAPLATADPEPLAPPERKSMSGTTEAPGHEQQVLGRIIELTVRHLGCEPAEVTPGIPFVEFGADSLQMINMVRELEREYSVKVGLRELFEQAGTPALLSALVAGRSAGAAVAAVPVPVTAAVPAAVPVRAVVPVPGPAPTPTPAAATAPTADAASPTPTPTPALTLETLADQIRVMQKIQLQMMTQLSELLTLQLSGGGGDR
jgi:acyl transferase domain-containing protein